MGGRGCWLFDTQVSDNARYSPPSISFRYISTVGISLYGTLLQREPPIVTPVLKPNVLDVALVALHRGLRDVADHITSVTEAADVTAAARELRDALPG